MGRGAGTITDFAALAEAIERERSLYPRHDDRLTHWTTFREMVAREDAYLELWARVQALEGAIATHGAEARGILRAYHEEDGKRLWLALRAALQPPETDR